MMSYKLPGNWIKYDPAKTMGTLTAAKAAIISLTTIPYQRSWVDQLQVIQLKREVAGTSQIEGAAFTENELDAAMEQAPDELFTRSQRQAAAMAKTYRWIAALPEDYPFGKELILEIHRLAITGAESQACLLELA